MPHYRADLHESGEPIDVIEFQARYPDTALPPDPRILEGIMRRDLWTRGEALLILAGFRSESDVTSARGVPCVLGNPGAGCGYLDGANDAQLLRAGLSHPLKDELQGNYRALRWYSEGQPLDETKPPQEWLAWVESKGFEPYWLGYWRERQGNAAGEPQVETTISGEDLLAFETAQEHQWNDGAIDYERWTDQSDALTVAQAARLMSGLDPDWFADLKLTKADSAGSAKQRAARFEQLAAAAEPPKERDTPAGWLTWAHKKRQKVHSPFHAFVAAKQAERANVDALERATLEAYREKYRRQEGEKKADGRYTLEEAAKIIEHNTGERAKDLQAKLMQAVVNETLAVYRPGELAKYKVEIVREFYEEAYWDDLNAWLEKYEPRITWRFPGQGNAKRSGGNLSAAVDWKTNAREIALRLLEEKPCLEKLNILQIAGKVREEMVSLNEAGEPGMINRSREVPAAESIKRHALTGIKNSG